MMPTTDDLQTYLRSQNALKLLKTWTPPHNKEAKEASWASTELESLSCSCYVSSCGFLFVRRNRPTQVHQPQPSIQCLALGKKTGAEIEMIM